MRIESVTAVAFGPFLKQTLELAPGLTVVHGDNESGKSSWHAATYAALCGRRRGKGGLRTEDREFRDRRRPWGGERWQVRCVVVLDDGRRIEVWHDLEGQVDCGAKDLTLGNDVSAQIMYEGAPDGSRWLGLNRQTFAATAVVNQADLGGVVASAELLQQDLQRAAATAGKDQTAAAALAALKHFHSDHVGLDRANAVRPLRTAIRQSQRAADDLHQAEAAHAFYLQRLAAAEEARAESAAASETRRTAERLHHVAARLVEAAREARLAAERATSLDQREKELTAVTDTVRHRFDRARALSAELGDEEPPGGQIDDALARQVTAAAAAWRSAPEVGPLEGRSSQELQDALDALPAAPAGDQRPAADLQRLRETLDDTATVLDSTERRRPVEPDVSGAQLAAALAAGPDVLLRLSGQVAEPAVRARGGLAAERKAAADDLVAARSVLAAAEDAEASAVASLRLVSAAKPTAPTASSAAALAVMSAGVVLAGVGLLLVVLGEVMAGVVALGLGLTSTAAGTVLRRRPVSQQGGDARSMVAAERGLAEARGHVAQARHRVDQSLRSDAHAQARADSAAEDEALGVARRQAAVNDAVERGLPTDAESLQRLVRRVNDVLAQQETFQRWTREHEADRRAHQQAELALGAALETRGYACSSGVSAAYDAYSRDCTTAAVQAELAARRPELLRRLAERQGAERRHAAAVAARRRALDALLVAAKALGIDLPPGDPDDAQAETLRDQVERWLDERTESLRDADERRSRWHDLMALLDGKTLPEMAAAAAAADEAALAARAAADDAAALSRSKQQQKVAASAAAGVPAVVDEAAAERLLAEHASSLQTAAEAQREAERLAAERTGQVESAAACLSVAEAEESVERAARELQRVHDLDEVLRLTTSYLERAQNDVFLDIAPVLAATLNDWLPRLTGGRYVEALIHPKNLRVQVREAATGQLRDAHLLSVGTAEQVYLLLRVALAEHLATSSAVSPLLLDDVTVQADPTRTVAILEMCKALADEGRQVVLFAQESAVAEWADQHLQAPQHRVVHLEPVPVA